MPELPEAETIVRDLQRRAPGRRVTHATVSRADVLTPPLTARGLARALRGRRVEAVERRGKNVVIVFENELRLVINLGMTGRLVASRAAGAARLRHVAARLELDDGSALLYDDARRFGRLQLCDAEQWRERSTRLGVEPLGAAFTAPLLHALTRGSAVAIRNWLLDQTKIAGVGNIYANEALFRAGVRPSRRARTLTRLECARLRDALRAVLAESIAARGTTISDFRDASGEPGGFDAWLRVYGRSGAPCTACSAVVKRIVLANRSAFYCPACQK